MNNERALIVPGFRHAWVSANVLSLGAGIALYTAVAEGIDHSGLLGSERAKEIGGHLIGLPLASAR